MSRIQIMIAPVAALLALLASTEPRTETEARAAAYLAQGARDPALLVYAAGLTVACVDARDGGEDGVYDAAKEWIAYGWGSVEARRRRILRGLATALRESPAVRFRPADIARAVWADPEAMGAGDLEKALDGLLAAPLIPRADGSARSGGATHATPTLDEIDALSAELDGLEIEVARTAAFEVGDHRRHALSVLCGKIGNVIDDAIGHREARRPVEHPRSARARALARRARDVYAAAYALRKPLAARVGT